MSVIRVNKSKNYTVMSNVHLRDKTISYKAKGLLSTVLSLPEDWEYSIKGLVAISKESETAVKNTMKELKEHGYLRVTKYKNKFGQFEYEYLFSENPCLEQLTVENLEVENPDVGNLEVDNVLQLNTKQTITKEENTKGLSTEQKNEVNRVDYKQIIDLFNGICVSYPIVKAITDNRKKAIKARLNKYSIEDITEVFEKAEASDFMKGANNRNWSATFDWIMKDSNMAKVLEGNYDNKAIVTPAQQKSYENPDGSIDWSRV